MLSDRDRYNEYLMTRLRTAEGIDLGELECRFGAARTKRTLREAERFAAAGTLVVTENRLAIPAEQWLVSDAVIGALFESE